MPGFFFSDKVGQLMQLAPQAQPDDIDTYICAHNEVKILRALYDLKAGKLQGIKQYVAAIAVRGDDNAQSFDYGYDEKNDTTRLYSVQKTKIPSSFRSTCFTFLKDKIESNSLRGDFSDMFFFLPSTIDRCEEVNKYLTMFYSRPVLLTIGDFGPQFNPAENFDRECMVSVLKKVVEQSSQNLLRIEALIWPRPNKTPALLFGQRVKKCRKNCLLLLIDCKLIIYDAGV